LVLSSDSVGAGMAGDWIGTTVACCTEAALTDSAAVPSTIATPTFAATTAATLLTVVVTAPPAVLLLPAVRAAIGRRQGARARLAGSAAAAKRGGILHAEEQALEVAVMSEVADTEEADGTNRAHAWAYFRFVAFPERIERL
jgi:hypothetical protein